MPKAQAIQINWQFTGSAGMQVEHTADCFGGAWFKSPLLTEVWLLLSEGVTRSLQQLLETWTDSEKWWRLSWSS